MTGAIARKRLRDFQNTKTLGCCVSPAGFLRPSVVVGEQDSFRVPHDDRGRPCR